MPLPTNSPAWPPKAIADIAPVLEAWSAWYDGSPDALRAVYQRANGGNLAQDKPAQHRGGVVGAWARFWWGRPLSTTQVRVDQLHVPIAADLCQTSADLLYAEPPQFTVDDEATQKVLDTLADEGLHTTLAAGAELGAALGGRFHRVTWDRAVEPDRPFVTTVDADAAYPEFRWGRLVAVTFWSVLERTGGKVWRHLERHDLDAAGRGQVQHGLYLGSDDKLGVKYALSEHPDTAELDKSTDADGYVLGGRSPGLLVVYIPNQTPQRRWRSHPVGRHLGRSDLDGIEPFMDSLDEVYSSWMRDIRLAKSRIFIPEYMLTSNGPGQGATWDADREAYVPIRSAAPEDGDATITLNQFAIRVEEHARTAQEWTEVILRSAGYSAQTFGEAGEGTALTATEVVARERRSYLTRDRKARVEGPAVAQLLEKLLYTAQVEFNTQCTPQRPTVAFGDTVQDSMLTLAQTVLALDQARAASTEVKVRLLHPDWDDKAVITEVAALTAANTPEPAVDPFAGV